MKSTIILSLIIMLSFFSCKKDELDINDLQCPVTAIQGEKNDIIGKWKLVKQKNAWGLPTIDYSCQNIIYEFKSDGNLLVTSGDGKNDLSIPLGSHEFELISTPLPNDPLKEVQSLSIIGDSMSSSWPCEISANEMTLSQAWLDGPNLTFYRIQ